MISYIVPTTGRPSIVDTLRSIELWPGDEILVIGKILPTGDERPRYVSCPSGNDWGCKERRIGLEMARGTHLSFMDDDDVYAPGARLAMERALEVAKDKPVLFRMQYPNGNTLWKHQLVECGNFGTPMIFVPNDPTKLGQWTGGYVGDFTFIDSMKWAKDEILWRDDVIALLGHS